MHYLITYQISCILFAFYCYACARVTPLLREKKRVECVYISKDLQLFTNPLSSVLQVSLLQGLCGHLSTPHSVTVVGQAAV